MTNDLSTITIGDLHFGIKRDDDWTYNNQYQFIKTLSEYALSNGIKTIIQTGDFFDVRSGITQLTLQRIRTDIMPLLKHFNIIVIIGNHDMKYRDVIQPNTIDEVLGFYDNVTIVNKPTTINVDNSFEMDFIPWICKENKEEIKQFIKNSNTKYCVGHFELSGYYYYKGIKSNGDNNHFLSGYDQVFSGHFHTISSGDNILYVGTPYTLTMSDANDERGFWVMRMVDGELKYSLVKNEVTHHQRINFDANTFDINSVSDYNNITVVLNVITKDSKDNKLTLSKVEDLLISNGVHELKIQDAINYDDVEVTPSTEIKIEDNRKIANDYISQLDITDDAKQRVKDIFERMYIESLTIKSEAGK